MLSLWNSSFFIFTIRLTLCVILTQRYVVYSTRGKKLLGIYKTRNTGARKRLWGMQRILLVQMFFRIPGKSFRRFWEILSRLKFERVPGNIPVEYFREKTNCWKQNNEKKKNYCAILLKKTFSTLPLLKSLSEKLSFGIQMTLETCIQNTVINLRLNFFLFSKTCPSFW